MMILKISKISILEILVRGKIAQCTLFFLDKISLAIPRFSKCAGTFFSAIGDKRTLTFSLS